MIFAQEVEDFFGLGGLGERGVAAQIAEHDDDFAAMAFEDFFVALRDDQLGKLRCEKPLQPSDTPQFLDLFSNPRFEAAVQLSYLIGALAQFVQQPRVLHCNNRLRGEILQQRDLLVGKRADLLAEDMEHAEQRLLLAQCDTERGAKSADLDQSAPMPVVRFRCTVTCQVRNFDYIFALYDPLVRGAGLGQEGPALAYPVGKARAAMGRCRMEALAVIGRGPHRTGSPPFPASPRTPALDRRAR